MSSVTIRREGLRYATARARSYLVAGLLLAYIIVIARSSTIGLGDMSDHLARAYIMADLMFHQGHTFGAQFHYHFMAVPYILPDLLLTGAVGILGPRIALVAWTVLTLLSLPAALLLYFRVNWGSEHPRLLEDDGALFLLLCALYLSTDFFFVVGFFAFELGLASVVVILTLIERLRRRWSNGLFALYGGLVTAAYLIHLSTLLFLATIVAVSALVRLWVRSSSLRHELLLVLPIGLMLIWHFTVAVHYQNPSDLANAVYRWGSLGGKLSSVNRNFHRYGGRLDQILQLLYVASLLMLIRVRQLRLTSVSWRLTELLALTAAFFVLYVALPFSYRDGTYIDIRALAPASICLLLACLQFSRPGAARERDWLRSSLPLGLAFVLSTLNLAYLHRHFAVLSSWSTTYGALDAAIPRRARVLPVSTRPDIYRYVDPSATTVIDRQAMIPYLFSANTGAPMTYFRFVDPHYTPPDDWYTTSPPPDLDWRQIACAYQYILITLPFDPQRIRVATRSIAETSSAALLAIDPGACGGTRTKLRT